MVARTFHVDHNGEQHLIEYDTENGFEVLQIQIFSLTSIPPEKQKLLGEGNVIINSDADLEKITEKLHMLSIDEEETRNSSQSAMEKADEELARKLQEEEDGLFLAQFSDGQGRRAFEEKVFPMVENVRRYEDTNRQEAARGTTPIDELEEKSLVCLAKEGNFKPSKNEKDHAFLLQLLFWFKGSFMWVNSPPCDNCNRETSAIGIDAPLSSEVKYDATRVELFSCKSCQRVTRFPRYNDPIKLLETRRGRCGEWANCFTLYCRAFGYDARLVLDFTDHVWTECFSHHLGRWMHLDPCEGVFDNPLLYEKGWGKKLNYLIAFGKDGACDVTKRYTRKWPEVLSRRVITTEFIVSSVLDDITITCRKGYSQDMIEKLKDRDRKEAEDLQGQFSEDFPSISLPGRQSGSKEWRVARSEYGSDSLSTSSCPIRRCIDRHVRNIYSAFSSLLFQLVNSSVSQVETLEVMIAIRNLLGHLKRAPFHTRQASITLNSTASMPNMVPYIDEVVSSLSLKGARASDGTMSLYLDDDPVQTSLALPVALDCIDEIINRISECCNLDKSSLSLPLLKFNRISCGSVRASGEEIPCGIATSAFDGTNISKWEEPNGANGCWLIYYVANTKMVALGAYELMSANDAPERDPMDWVLEGSNDAGFNWFVLDEQKSQKFNKRFERKTYKLESTRNLSNAFRFRFLAVWNAKATSRFQIGSIDLYERED